MEKMRVLFLTYGVLLLAFVSCKEDGPVDMTLSDGLEYFPLRLGWYQEYTVDTEEYTSDHRIIDKSYELRVEIADKFQNQEGGTTYVVHRFERPSQDSLWVLSSVWSLRYDGTYMISVEENVPFVKLAFPLYKGKVWDGNSFNTREGDSYELRETEIPYALENGTVAAVTVLQEDQSNLLYKESRKETYGKGIGLLFRESIDLEYCDISECAGSPPGTVIKKGLIYRQKLKSYGKK